MGSRPAAGRPAGARVDRAAWPGRSPPVGTTSSGACSWASWRSGCPAPRRPLPEPRDGGAADARRRPRGRHPGRSPDRRRTAGRGFEDVTAGAGLDHPHHNRKFKNPYAEIMAGYTALGAAAAVADFDGDGFEDIFVTDSAEDGKNHLYHNNGDLTLHRRGGAGRRRGRQRRR